MFNNLGEGEKYIIFNIGTFEITGGVVSFDSKKQKPVIEYSVSRRISVDESDALKNFRQNSFQTLKFIVNEVEKYIMICEDVFNVSEIFLFLGSP
jgi:hypothetical protein